MWTLQATSFSDLIQKMQQYSLEGIGGQITCPTLIYDAESDRAFAGQPRMVFDALRCRRSYLFFTAEDTAEAYCHVAASLLLNQRIFD